MGVKNLEFVSLRILKIRALKPQIKCSMSWNKQKKQPESQQESWGQFGFGHHPCTVWQYNKSIFNFYGMNLDKHSLERLIYHK